MLSTLCCLFLFTDDDDDDGEEVLTCEVCDRAFPTIKKLSDHQEKKKHFG